MVNKRLAALVAVIALGVAACSGGAVSTTPAVQATPSGTGISGSGAAVAATGVSGISSTVTVTGTGSVTGAEASTAPTGLPALSSLARQSAESLKSAQAVSNTPLLYIQLLATSATSITGLPAASITFATAPTGSIYLAYYTSNAWVTIAGPATVSGSTVTFAATTFANPVNLVTGASLFLAVYTGGVLVTASPTPGPTSSATATASPTATATASATATPTASATPTHSPSPSPSATATSSATPVAVQAITNGTFETGDLTGWYACYANHDPVGPVNASPAPYTSADPTAAPTPPGPSPTPKATANPDTTAIAIASSVPNGAVHGGSKAVLIGHSDVVKRGKGNLGICQDITIPAFNASLSLSVYEGGNHPSLYNNDVEAELYPSGSFTTAGPGLAGTMSTAATPTQILFLEQNCYDNLSTTVSYNGMAAGLCFASTGAAAHGGVWESKGPYSLASYAGMNMTLFIGIMGTSTSTSFYGYAYYDDITLTGTTTASRARIPGR